MLSLAFEPQIHSVFICKLLAKHNRVVYKTRVPARKWKKFTVAEAVSRPKTRPCASTKKMTTTSWAAAVASMASNDGPRKRTFAPTEMPSSFLLPRSMIHIPIRPVIRISFILRKTAKHVNLLPILWIT